MENPEKIARLRRLIHDHLEKNRVFDAVKEMIEKDAISEALAMERVIETLGQQEVLADVMREIDDLPRGPPLEASKKYLLVKVQYGKAFIDFMDNKDTNLTMQVHLSFLQQRFSSKKVVCCSEPVFDDSFLLHLSNSEVPVDFSALVKLSAPVHLVVTVESSRGKEVLATKNIEWRAMLTSPSLSFPIELLGVGTKSKVAVGALYLQMDVMPKTKKIEFVSDRLVNEQINIEKKYEREIAHSFFEYSNEWWKDYKQIRAGHDKRLVKIYAESEDGTYKPVVSLVQPLKTNRMIDSPLQAARFVSLIPFERSENPGGTRPEVWYSMHTFLSKGKGDCEEHSILLAGLLLGFGLDAYVCLGSSGDGPHAWVVSLGPKVVFWESLTGQKISFDDPRVHRFYRKVGCVFNHKSFYGNIQVDDVVANTCWDLQNENMWKSMAVDVLDRLVGVTKQLPLLPPLGNVALEEGKLENDVKKMISSNRERNDLMTHWDDDLAYLLAPALVNYELDRVGGVTYGNEEFQQSIKRYVPEGHTFKAFPTQVLGLKANDIMAALVKNSVAVDIIQTRGDTVRFAFRIKVVPYPEEITAVWVMLAVRYRSVV
jgi:centrosomal protein CEP76